MKPVLLNTYDWGGAGIATRRLLNGLKDIGVDAKMLVQHKRSDHEDVIGPEGLLRRAYSAFRILSDPLPTKLYNDIEGNFSIGWLPDDINRQIGKLNPDIIHLNWVGEGFFNVKSIGDMSAPIVWRLPDMWAFTGGCHYSGDCTRYEQTCGACPRLGSTRDRDLTRWTFNRKAESWEDQDMTVVATSTWLAEAARNSSLFSNRRIEIIPNALDTSIFRPTDTAKGRELFDISTDKQTVLFGAQFATSDPRKGFDLLENALQWLYDRQPDRNIELVVFGGSEPEEGPDFGYPVRYLGYLQNDRDLAKLYSAADVMVVPSRYEGFGQTASEALACGTPVVAFDATGPSDIIDHQETGYLAEPYDPKELAEGIEWVLADGNRRANLSQEARVRASDRYNLTTVAGQYVDLYEDILS